MDAKNAATETLPLSVRSGALVSNQLPFAVDALPECQKQAGNNQPGSAQEVTLPVIINGRIDRPGDWDVFRFEGRAGEQIVAEVDAPKLQSPLDSVLKLTDASNRQLAFNDDYVDKGSGLSTHHADSLLTSRCPQMASIIFIWASAASRRGGICLSAAHERASARFCIACCSVGHKRPGRQIGPAYRLRVAGGRFCRRDFACLKGRTTGICIKLRAGAGECRADSSDVDRAADRQRDPFA